MICHGDVEESGSRDVSPKFASKLTVAKIEQLANTVRTTLLSIQSTSKPEQLSEAKVVVSKAIKFADRYRQFMLPPVLDLGLLQKDIKGDIDVVELSQAVEEAEDFYPASETERAIPVSFDVMFADFQQKFRSDNAMSHKSAGKQAIYKRQSRDEPGSVSSPLHRPSLAKPRIDTTVPVVKRKVNEREESDGDVLPKRRKLASTSKKSTSESEPNLDLIVQLWQAQRQNHATKMRWELEEAELPQDLQALLKDATKAGRPT